MMGVDRRSLIKGILNTLALYVGSKISGARIADLGIPFEVQYRCKVTDLSAGTAMEQYDLHRKSFEDFERIAQINTSYSAQGRLLSVDFKQMPDSLLWTYRFRSEQDYEAWNTRVYFGGLFSRRRLPAGFEWQYQTRHAVESIEVPTQVLS